MITKQAFIIVEFKERGLLFYIQGLLLYVFRKMVYYSALKGLLFYVFKKRVYYSTFSGEWLIILRFWMKDALVFTYNHLILRSHQKSLLLG